MRAQEAFSRAVFPEGHPNHPHSIEEFLAALKSATLEDVKTFHAAYYGPAHFTLVLVGDVDMAQAQSAVGSAFAGWTGGRDYLRPPVTALPPAQPEIVVPLADKTSVTVFLGQSTGLRYRDPGALALRVGTAILGNGFTGRLMHNVRDKQGLTYSIGAAVTGDNFAQGAWEISASFAPALLDKGIAAAREQLQNWWAEGVSDAELEERRQGIVGSYFVGLSTTAGIGSAVLSATQRGLGLSWLDEYPQAVKALTRAQINDAIKAHLNPSAMVLVKAGSVAAAAH
jgi:zinc protease